MTKTDLNPAAMDSSRYFLLAADALLVLHALFVAFVVSGLVLIFVGKVRRWSWVRNPWFRVTHLLAIGIVVVQSWLGVICPLTRFEMALRLRAGETVYAGSFMSHWLDTLLYYQAPWWVFVVCYTVFGAAVVGSWFWVSPRPFTSLTDQGSDPGCPGRLSNRRSLVYRIAAWLKSLLQRRPGSGER